MASYSALSLNANNEQDRYWFGPVQTLDRDEPKPISDQTSTDFFQNEPVQIECLVTQLSVLRQAMNRTGTRLVLSKL